MIMIRAVSYSLKAGALLLMLSACASFYGRNVVNTFIVKTERDIPEETLLDVGVLVCKSGEMTGKKAKREGTNADVRNAEEHFISYHLKKTLEKCGYWGMVKVTPLESDAADVLVDAKIIESNGENLVLKVAVKDSSGNLWFKKRYRATVGNSAYKHYVGETEVFQGLYNAIANDMSKYLEGFSPKEIEGIRALSQLKFARNFAPYIFGDYLKEVRHGSIAINRLPADDDPIMERILKIREREYMFVDTINKYYEEYYNTMWPSYRDWRKFNLHERRMLAEQKRSALLQQTAGVVLFTLAMVLAVQGIDTSGILTPTLMIFGTEVFLNGTDIFQNAQMHYEALAELSESFGNEAEPVVVEFQEKMYKLTGSVEEQYKQWRELLRKLYSTETGFSLFDSTDSENL